MTGRNDGGGVRCHSFFTHDLLPDPGVSMIKISIDKPDVFMFTKASY